jgi:hypothetical protein
MDVAVPARRPVAIRMSVRWFIESRARTVALVAEGEVSLDQVKEYLDAVAGANALAYGKLVDVRKATSAMTADELMLLMAMLREYHQQGPMGPLAVVATDEQSVIFARLLGALASAERPMKLFSTELRARRWLQRIQSATNEESAPP